MSDRAEQRVGVATFRSIDAPPRTTIVRGGAMTRPPTPRELRIAARSLKEGQRRGLRHGIALGFVFGVMTGALAALFCASICRAIA